MSLRYRSNIESIDPLELRKVKGLGAAKIAALVSATEIARRQLKEEIIGKNILRDAPHVRSCRRYEKETARQVSRV